MKANELMIGDWVYDTILKCNTRVELLSMSGIRVDCNERVWDEKTFEPIPLTPEILEKNGWEERKEYDPYIYYLLEGKNYPISLSKEWNSTTKTIYWSLSIENYGTDATLSIDFIHQLQHALRLCGIEKEIML